MSRSDSFLEILEASANIQFNISLILEAKAGEAEKSRDWICNYLNHGVYETHEEQLKQPLDMHEQFVELIDGLTKLESALAKNLKIVLNKDDESSSGRDGFGSLFNLGDS